MTEVIDEPYVKFTKCVRECGFPIRSAHQWKDKGIFPFVQIGALVFVKKSELLAGVEKFRRTGKKPKEENLPQTTPAQVRAYERGLKRKTIADKLVAEKLSAEVSNANP